MQSKMFNSSPNKFLPGFRSWLTVYFNNFCSKNLIIVRHLPGRVKRRVKRRVKAAAVRPDMTEQVCSWSEWEKSRRPTGAKGSSFVSMNWVKISSVSFPSSFHHLYTWLVEHWDRLKKKKSFCCFELSGFIVKRAETDQLVKQAVSEIVGDKVVQFSLGVGFYQIKCIR